MFGLRTSKNAEPAAEPQGSALDRIGRRVTAEGRPDTPAGSNHADRLGRLAAAAANLTNVVAPRLRELVAGGAPAGEVTRQAGSLVQIHFRGHGMVLAPLELRGYVSEVLRPILPATSFSAPAAVSADQLVDIVDGAAAVAAPSDRARRRCSYRRWTQPNAGPQPNRRPPLRGSRSRPSPRCRRSRRAACRAARSSRRVAPYSRW